MNSKYKNNHTREHQSPHKQETLEMCSVFLREIVWIPNSWPSWNMLDFSPLIHVRPKKLSLLCLTSGISSVWKKNHQSHCCGTRNKCVFIMYACVL